MPGTYQIRAPALWAPGKPQLQQPLLHKCRKGKETCVQETANRVIKPRKIKNKVNYQEFSWTGFSFCWAAVYPPEQDSAHLRWHTRRWHSHRQQAHRTSTCLLTSGSRTGTGFVQKPTKVNFLAWLQEFKTVRLVWTVWHFSWSCSEAGHCLPCCKFCLTHRGS